MLDNDSNLKIRFSKITMTSVPEFLGDVSKFRYISKTKQDNSEIEVTLYRKDAVIKTAVFKNSYSLERFLNEVDEYLITNCFWIQVKGGESYDINNVLNKAFNPYDVVSLSRVDFMDHPCFSERGTFSYSVEVTLDDDVVTQEAGKLELSHCALFETEEERDVEFNRLKTKIKGRV